MGMLRSYVFLMFGFAVVLYLLGYAPIQGPFAAKGSSIQDIADPNNPRSESGSLITGAILGVLILVAATSLIIGFSAIYVVPLFILIAVIDLFIFPMDFMFGIPQQYQIIILAFLNIFRVLVVVDFTRGQS